MVSSPAMGGDFSVAILGDLDMATEKPLTVSQTKVPGLSVSLSRVRGRAHTSRGLDGDRTYLSEVRMVSTQVHSSHLWLWRAEDAGSVNTWAFVRRASETPSSGRAIPKTVGRGG